MRESSCSKCKGFYPLVPGASIVVCAHVHGGEPCEDTAYTRAFISEVTSKPGAWRVSDDLEEWQCGNFNRLMEDVDTW